MITSLKAAAIFTPCLILCLVTSSANAQESETAKKSERFSPTGTWNWERKSGDDSVKCKLIVSKKKDGTFSGKYEDKDRKLPIKNAKLTEGNFSFDVSPHAEMPDKTIQFKGKVTADSIKGNMSYAVGDKQKSTQWLAKRFEPLKPVIGKWTLEFETPNGDLLEFTIDVKKKGDRLQLSFVDDESETKVKQVKFKKGKLSFDTDQVYQNMPIHVEWDLEIIDDRIDGVLFYSFDNSQDEGEIEVVGDRVK